MQINFDNISVKTVKPDYSWDLYNPSEDNMQEADFTDFEYVIGYAPFVNVQLDTSITDINPYSLVFEREVNFGDYYNSETNTEMTSITGSYVFGHNYIMPGEYTIKVAQTEYIKVNNPCCDPPCENNLTRASDLFVEQGAPTKRLPYSWMWYCFMQNDVDPRNEFFGALEAGSQCLTWEDCEFQSSRQITWDEAAGPAFEVRSRDVSWQWKKVVCDPNEDELYTQKVEWSYTKQDNFLPRTWKQIKNLGCDGINCLEVVPILSAHSITKVYEKKIKVLEILPEAYLTLISQVTGDSLTAHLSPRLTRCGSFPIEKIIWDLGDGTPFFEQTRWSVNTDPKFVFNKEIEQDVYDPRNYDVVHTYSRNFANGSCFYPSITAVSSSTSSTDRAALTIGPVMLENINNDIELIQTDLTDQGRAYMGQVKDNIVFWNLK